MCRHTPSLERTWRVDLPWAGLEPRVHCPKSPSGVWEKTVDLCCACFSYFLGASLHCCLQVHVHRCGNVEVGLCGRKDIG